jgi:alkanesulfonate monooxygenase SsuD/methylene tetrahydromethanopterin reductase-like flavin-dependent oxidoreductase (luciferase family)
MADLRFCAYQYQHLPLVALEQRWREAERAGFDVLWKCDTVVEPDRARHKMFDGPATLTLMAAATTRIRVGTLVTSVYFRHPVTSAKAAMTLDHLSGGRVEIALGVGDPSAGAAMAAVDEPVAERVARFAEFVELADLLLRQEVTDYQGRYYRVRGGGNHPPARAAAAAPDHRRRARAADAPHRRGTCGRMEFLGWLRRADRRRLLRHHRRARPAL